MNIFAKWKIVFIFLIAILILPWGMLNANERGLLAQGRSEEHRQDDKRNENSRRADEEKKRKEDEDRRRREDAEKERKAEQERKQREDQERRQKAEQERQRKAEEDRKNREQAERERKAEQERKQREDQERRQKAEQERQRKAEEDRKNREQAERERKEKENQRDSGQGNKYGHDKDEKDKEKEHEDNRDRGEGNKYGHDKDEKEKEKENNRDRGRGNKFGHNKKNKDKNKATQKDKERDAERAELLIQLAEILLKLNFDAWYTPYPYYSRNPNFLENWMLQPGSYLRSDLGGEKYGQKVPVYYRKFFFNIDVAGQYLSPTYGSLSTTFHGRLFSFIGPLFEYQGIQRDKNTFNIFKAGLDMAIVQFANMTFSTFWQYTWFKLDSDERFQDHTWGLMLMVFPVKPISLTMKYSYMDYKARVYQYTSIRVGVHIWRFEVFTGYYRHSFSERRFMDGVESGIKMWF